MAPGPIPQAGADIGVAADMQARGVASGVGAVWPHPTADRGELDAVAALHSGRTLLAPAVLEQPAGGELVRGRPRLTCYARHLRPSHRIGNRQLHTGSCTCVVSSGDWCTPLIVILSPSCVLLYECACACVHLYECACACACACWVRQHFCSQREL